MLSLTRCAYGARSTPARPTPAVHTVRADCRAAQGCVPRPTKATSQRLGADWRRRGPGGVGVGVGGHGRVTRCLRRRGGGCCYAGAEADTSAFTNSISALSSEQLAERVVWLPPMRRSNASASVMPDFDAATAETASANNMRTMPFFALGKEPYLPGSEQVGLERMTSSGPPHPHTPAAMPHTRINPTRALESPHRAPQTGLSNDTAVHPPTPALPPTTLTTTAPRREQWVLEKATQSCHPRLRRCCEHHGAGAEHLRAAVPRDVQRHSVQRLAAVRGTWMAHEFWGFGGLGGLGAPWPWTCCGCETTPLPV